MSTRYPKRGRFDTKEGYQQCLEIINKIKESQVKGSGLVPIYKIPQSQVVEMLTFKNITEKDVEDMAAYHNIEVDNITREASLFTFENLSEHVGGLPGQTEPVKKKKRLSIGSNTSEVRENKASLARQELGAKQREQNKLRDEELARQAAKRKKREEAAKIKKKTIIVKKKK